MDTQMVRKTDGHEEQKDRLLNSQMIRQTREGWTDR